MSLRRWKRLPTNGHPTGGKETTILSILMLIHGMIIVGDPTSVGGHFIGVGTVGAPDQEALKAARALGKRVAQVAKVLKFCNL